MRRKDIGARPNGAKREESCLESLHVSLNAKLSSELLFSAAKGHSSNTLKGLWHLYKAKQGAPCDHCSQGLSAVLKDFSRRVEDSYLTVSAGRAFQKKRLG